LHNTLHLIVIQDTEFLAENLEARTGVGTYEHKITFLAPRTRGELGRIFVRVWSDPDYEQHRSGMLFRSHGRSISNKVEARTGDLFIDFRNDTQ
jgi:hypothetical protein